MESELLPMKAYGAHAVSELIVCIFIALQIRFRINTRTGSTHAGVRKPSQRQNAEPRIIVKKHYCGGKLRTRATVQYSMVHSTVHYSYGSNSSVFPGCHAPSLGRY